MSNPWTNAAPGQLGTHSTMDGTSDGTAPATRMSAPYLLLFEGDSARMVTLPGGDFTIGRGETADLRLDEERVSRVHARLTPSGGQWRLTDLGSHNGTLVNDERVTVPRLLASGDVISIAGVALLFQTTSRAQRPALVLDGGAFRSRAEVELERACGFFRPLAVVDFSFATPPDREQVQSALEATVRRVDFACWSVADHLAVFLPEADADEGKALTHRLLEAFGDLQLPARAGLATCPEDAADVETLLAAARAASSAGAFGEIALAVDGFRTLELGDKSVLVADASMVRLYELVQRLATSELPVLVQGETGAGKELVATALHHFSLRSAQQLLAVNCAALHESLLESELFGHERGAFTGAVKPKPGLLEVVNGGTVFLDEVGEMSAGLQAKLLRALESRRITRVGDTREREVDFRVVAATHQDLLAAVKAGKFRQDLYFRLAGATVWLPPLRDRRRELPMLARRFLEEGCTRAGKPPPLLAPETMQLLAAYPWPGNVRELRNVMDFAAATVMEPVLESWHLRERLAGVDAPP
ncbi:MAG: sigma 54-interacting transcriptional regulator, partial [Myxococcaceae bacterium]